MSQLPGYYTRPQAATLLGVSGQRVAVIAQRDDWTAYQVGRSWLYVKFDVDRTALKMDAQRAWAILRIPRHLWGAWWLADPDRFTTLTCPDCNAAAYSPAGNHPRYSILAACPSCGWTKEEREQQKNETP
jgi:hypothetical protein